MTEFTVRFIGHINERTRSEGFPEDIVAIGTYRVDTNKEIAGVINNELMAFIHQVKGMIVQLDPAQTADMSKLNTEGRVFVPMHQIAYIRTEISIMSPMPTLVETGALDANGKLVKEYQTPEGFKILPS